MAQASEFASVSAARWLVGVIAGVVLCFTFATAVGEHLDSAIAARTNDIVANAMPSVQALSTARGDLWRLEMALDRYEDTPPDQRTELRDEISAARHNVDAALVSYLALPFFPNERELYAHARDDLASLDKRTADYLSRGDPAALQSARRDFDIVDQSLERIVLYDAEQGQRLGLEIQRIRGETRSIVVLLDAASVALAIGAALLALRQLRRAAQAHKAEREARERHETELSAQNEALGQFAGRVAHDVLSPLSTAMLALELVQHTSGKDSSALRATERGIAAVLRVQTLVDGLLAFSRAAGRPEPGASTEIAPVLTDLIDAVSVQAREQRIELIVGAIPKASVACSKGVLTSLLSNLLRNAIKYMGDATDRRIDVRVIDLRDRWRVEVEDTGPGIPKEQQVRIFQPHVQLGRDSAGIGLGLATVDRLVRAHAGSLGVNSPPGRGSLFWFELPKPATESADLVRGRAPLDHAAT